jgi:hypothetical protein
MRIGAMITKAALLKKLLFILISLYFMLSDLNNNFLSVSFPNVQLLITDSTGSALVL